MVEQAGENVAARPAPLIVQHDGRLLLAGAAGRPRLADTLRRFAELEKCAGDYDIYRLTTQALWNAAAAGISASRITTYLAAASGAPVPAAVSRRIEEVIARHGALRLRRAADGLRLHSADPDLLVTVASALDLPLDDAAAGLPVAASDRGWLKHRLAHLGYPVRDEVGYVSGGALALDWQPDVALRPYQREAIGALTAPEGGGSGVVLLPCGAGKTLVGVGVTVALGCHTLVLCPNATAVQQWCAAYRAFTTIEATDVVAYRVGGDQVRPVTVATYQMLTARKRTGSGMAGFAHLPRFMNHGWGLIVYDEVHLLPADVFRLTADVQSRRRLGLTATPVREDGRETDLFALVGPVLYSAPWRRLEAAGWIAPAECVEVRVPVAIAGEGQHASATHRQAATADKWPVVRALVRRHRGEQVLILGHYLDQLRELAERLRAPIVTGQTPAAERARLFERFRRGDERVLLLSRVGNAALDLPNAAVAIEVSGNFGSRQEEAQRLGRVLRPKDGRAAYFYAVVADDAVEREHAARRQRYLVAQGYHYRIVPARDLSRLPVPE